mmetsp:Transcript_1033/g.1599  ORF Transcript_1033/g.1599 Transcript_1033/m.1599 type:complete len:82 (+) Transcript_1033:523-768(+)
MSWLGTNLHHELSHITITQFTGTHFLWPLAFKLLRPAMTAPLRALNFGHHSKTLSAVSVSHYDVAHQDVFVRVLPSNGGYI